MKTRTILRLSTLVVIVAGIAYLYGWYDAYAAADKACLRAQVGAPAETAGVHLRAVAAAQNAVVNQIEDLTMGTFRWLWSDAAVCTFRSRDGRVVERHVGAPHQGIVVKGVR